MIATLSALRYLTDLVARHLYAAELEALLGPLPEPARRQFEARLWDQIAHRGWTDRLFYLRAIRKRVEKSRSPRAGRPEL